MGFHTFEKKRDAVETRWTNFAGERWVVMPVFIRKVVARTKYNGKPCLIAQQMFVTGEKQAAIRAMKEHSPCPPAAPKDGTSAQANKPWASALSA
jgi:hypothetical protein